MSRHMPRQGVIPFECPLTLGAGIRSWCGGARRLRHVGIIVAVFRVSGCRNQAIIGGTLLSTYMGWDNWSHSRGNSR